MKKNLQKGNAISKVYQDYHFLHEPFLIVSLQSTNEPPYFYFSPSFDEIVKTVQNIFKKIVSVSENIPRIEKLLFSGNYSLPNFFLHHFYTLL